MMKQRLVICLLAICLGAGPALIDPSPAPKSESGTAAFAKYNAGLQRAYDVWRQAQIKAGERLSADLNVSLRIAVHAEHLDDSVILERLRKESDARVALLKNPPSALIGLSGSTVWQFGEHNRVEFHDGTMAKVYEKKHFGSWTQNGQTAILIWNFGNYVDTLKLNPDGTTLAWSNNRGQGGTATLVEPASQPSDPQLLDWSSAPTPDSGLAAIYKFNAAIQRAYGAWREAQRKIEQQLFDDLSASLKIAVNADHLDEAVILEQLRNESGARLEGFKIPPSELVGTDGSATWRYDKTGTLIKFRQDGTVVATGDKSHRGTWSQAGGSIICVWNSGDSIERFELSPDGTSMEGGNNKGETIRVSLVGATSRATTQIATNGPTTAPTTKAATEPTATMTKDGTTQPSTAPTSQSSSASARATTTWFDDPTSKPATQP
jgi:hypothetical protein